MVDIEPPSREDRDDSRMPTIRSFKRNLRLKWIYIAILFTYFIVLISNFAIGYQIAM